MTRALRGRWFALGALAALVGCTGSAPGPRLQIEPAALGASLSLVQHATLTRGAQRISFDVVLDISPNAIDAVAVGLGLRLATLHYDGRRVEVTRAAGVPAALSGELLLRDLLLINYPSAALRAALPPGWTLEESVGLRQLKRHGVLRIEVRHADEPRWLGHSVLRDLPAGYELTIESVLR